MGSTILIVNPLPSEGKKWRTELADKGFFVLTDCLSLSAMTDQLMREKVHIVLCAANLINQTALKILEAAAAFFPRIKIIIVGAVHKSYVLSHMTHVAIANSFDSAVENFCESIIEATLDLSQDDVLSILLAGHFLCWDELERLLARSFNWTPGYVIIGITADVDLINVKRVLDLENRVQDKFYVWRHKPDAYYLIMHQSPDAEEVTHLAEDIRNILFTQTNASFSIGISRMRHKAGELYACRKEADAACGAAYVYGQNSIIHVDYLGANDILYIYPMHKEQKLIEATMNGNTVLAYAMLDGIFEALKSCKGLKQGLANKIILGILTRLHIAATARAYSLEKMNLDSLALSKLLAAKTIDEAYLFLKEGINEFAKEMDALTDVSRDALFYKLESIKGKGEQAGISDLMKRFGTTAGFINAAIYKNSGGDLFSYFK
jgi:hypothetical protein